MKLNRIAMTGVAGVLGLGLIGVGAHAAFTTTTQSKQTVSAGTLSMILHATPADVTGPNTARTITLDASTDNGSTFSTGTIEVHQYNNGTVTAYNIKETIGVSHGVGAPTAALETEAYICLASPNGGAGNHAWVLYNGPLRGAPHTISIGGTETTTTTSTAYFVNVYAGTEHTYCGSVTTYGGTAPTGGGTSTSASLLNTAEGGSITVTNTVSYQG